MVLVDFFEALGFLIVASLIIGIILGFIYYLIMKK